MHSASDWSRLPARTLNAAAVRFPSAALAYRSGRRWLRATPQRLKRSVRPLSIWVRKQPLPPRLLRAVWWLRTGERNVAVPIDRLLLGGENGLAAADYAALTNQPMRPSTPIDRSPHVSLLDRARREGGLGDWFSDSDYLANARLCVDVTGHYFGAVDEEGIRSRAEAFVTAGASAPAADPGVHGRAHSSHTLPDQAIRVRSIKRSNHYEIVDGHHRIAEAWCAGSDEVSVDVERLGASTPLQQLLNGMSWIDGSAELYQPVDAPEVSTWSLVRHCSDRLAKMTTLLESEGITSDRDARYLDVGSCYGWFVAQMAEQGWDARGIELDPTAPTLGALVYDLDPARITVGDCADVLRPEPNAGGHRADVVSCFSVLHHFELGKGSCSATELLARLDAATGTVLFFDTGQSHEEWFSHTLGQWDADFIERWVLDNSSFRRVLRLGTDDDAVPPYETNYGRMLFACLR